MIDAATGTIYLLARTKESGSYVQRLHALDIATGASRPGSPVTITGSVGGIRAGFDAGPTVDVTFNPKMQSQRAALALSNGVVLIAWASHEDAPPYHGWVMGYDAATLAQVGMFCVTPDVVRRRYLAGRPRADDRRRRQRLLRDRQRPLGWDAQLRQFAAQVQRQPRGGFSLLDYFTPGNHEQLNADDDDLSGSGFTLLPGTNLLLGGGKEGVLYLLDANNLGRMAANDTQIVQRIDGDRRPRDGRRRVLELRERSARWSTTGRKTTR